MGEDTIEVMEKKRAHYVERQLEKKAVVLPITEDMEPAKELPHHPSGPGEAKGGVFAGQEVAWGGGGATWARTR